MSRETASGPSIEILKRGRDKDRLELEELRAQNVALQHQLGGKANPVLVEVARALLLGALIADPLQANQINGDRVMRTKPVHTDPGEATRVARTHERVLHRSLRSAVERFNQAVDYWNENDGRFPPPPPKEPQVRCVNDQCKEGYGKRIPKFVGPRGVMIELTQCSQCGNRLVAA